jgi:biotin carboxyl carrier protein
MEDLSRVDEIERLADLIAKSGVAELTLRAGDRRITLRRALSPLASAPPAPPKPMEPKGAMSASPALSVEKTVAPPRIAEAPPPLHWITAPMVGIFHPLDSPITPGARVEKGQVVGLIESMKLMNDVRAQEAGVICEVAIEAETPVEYGQPLFALTD